MPGRGTLFVLFLDDLQWLDAATLDLIKHLVTEPDARHLLLVGAYRENEVGLIASAVANAGGDSSGERSQSRRSSSGRFQSKTSISLFWMFLHCEPQTALDPLAQLIHEKTGGNPFFAIQFLTALSEEGLLVFQPGTADVDLGFAEDPCQGLYR